MGDKKTLYRGVTPAAVKKLTIGCEKLMLLWLNKHTKSSFTTLNQYKSATGSETVDMAEDFQFDNTFEAQESADPFGVMGLFDDISSDEGEA